MDVRGVCDRIGEHDRHAAIRGRIAMQMLFGREGSLNLLLDFDLIERGVRGAAPKYMEWFAGLGLLVTLVWLYLELLRLLARLRN